MQLKVLTWVTKRSHKCPGHKCPRSQKGGHKCPGHKCPGHKCPGHKCPGHKCPGHKCPATVELNRVFGHKLLKFKNWLENGPLVINLDHC